MNDWLSVRVHPGTGREAVIAALFAAGAQGVQEDGEELVTVFPGDVDPDVVVGFVLDASRDARVDTAPAPAVDWSERWKEGIQAQELGALVVTPPWLAHRYDASRAIIIEPGMAFGTGEHATTRGVIRLMQSVLRGGERVADLGAGSAVLSIAAAKLGAARVVAIELDPDAIENAQENVERNGVADRVHLIEGDALALLPLVAPVELVLANIISSVLLSLLPGIAGALAPGSGSCAILSGLLREERAEMLRAFAGGKWRVLAEDHEDAWWTVMIAR